MLAFFLAFMMHAIGLGAHSSTHQALTPIAIPIHTHMHAADGTGGPPN